MSAESRESGVPQIRFNQFAGAWAAKNLPEEVSFYAGLTYSPLDVVKRGGTLVLRSSNVQDGEIETHDNVYVRNEAVNSQNVQLGDIVVVVRNGSRNLIGKHALVKKDMPNTVIGAFMAGVASQQPEFVNALFDTQSFQDEVNRNLGATINQITGGMFKQMMFFFPCKREQTAIGQFFAEQDKLIAQRRQQEAQTRQFKQAMLGKMFPARGEKQPHIRLQGFSGDWQEVKLGDVIDREIKGKAQLEKLGKGNTPYLDANHLNGGKPFLSDGTEDVSERDILIIWDGSNAGKVYTEFRGALGSTLKAYRAAENCYPYFLFQELARNESVIFNQYRTPNIPHVVKDFTDEYFFLVPSLEEQTAIGQFFKQLDDTLALHGRQIALLQNLKAACLQKMFA